MTTIATDGRTMAGDGITTSLDIVMRRNAPKVRRLPDGSIFGFAGRTADANAIFGWLADGAKGSPPKIKEGRALILRPGGRIEHLGEDGDLIEIEAPAAVGSGGDIALGAMEFGASPKQAVEIAARRDPFTGGRIVEEALT